MSKKRRKALVAMLLFFIVSCVALSSWRHYDNVFVEMIAFPWGWYGEDAPVYRFIIQNDGTFITYTGVSIHGNVARSSLIMWPFGRSRAREILSDEEFHTISKIVSKISEYYTVPHMVVHGWGRFVLLYYGNVYESNIWGLNILYNELARLSPLITEYDDPCVLARLRMEHGL